MRLISEFDASCPHCHRILECHSSFVGEAPMPGDFSICVHCRGLSSFDEDLELRPLTDFELRDLEHQLAPDEDITAFIRNITSSQTRPKE